MIPTVLDPQQLLEVLAGFPLHDGLTGTDVCKRQQTLRNAGVRSRRRRGAGQLTQAQQPMLLLQTFEFFRHKGLNLLDVHPLTLLQEEQQLETSPLTVTIATMTHKSPHVIGALQIPGLLTQVAKDVGEMLVPDLAEDLRGSPDVSVPLNGPAAVGAQSPPCPESSAGL